jgi:hypothetical protein
MAFEIFFMAAVGVHIRYGKLAGKQMDKVNEAQRVPLTYYVWETLRLVRRVRADRVFVAAGLFCIY